MKVLIFGNIGSGKTTLIERLRKIFPFEKIAIDDFRRNYSDGSREGELIARNQFYKAIQRDQNQFIECLGVGKVADKLFEILSENDGSILCLTLLTPTGICKSRLTERNWDIPFPHPIKNISSLIERTEKKIQTGEVTKKWRSRDHTIVMSKYNEKVDDIETIATDLTEIIALHTLLHNE